MGRGRGDAEILTDVGQTQCWLLGEQQEDLQGVVNGHTYPLSGSLHYSLQEPYGVVGRIIPFNHPLFFAAGKIAAPLVAGNAVVLKTPDQTPLSGLRMAELAAEVFGPDLCAVISGRGRRAVPRWWPTR